MGEIYISVFVGFAPFFVGILLIWLFRQPINPKPRGGSEDRDPGLPFIPFPPGTPVSRLQIDRLEKTESKEKLALKTN